MRDYFEGKAKILLIVSIPQDVFVASGATVKPSLVFLKKFTEAESQQYQNTQKQAEQEAENLYDTEIQEKNKELKDTKIADEKKRIKIEISGLESKKTEMIKKLIKEKFNYQIAIAEVEKAGVSTTGSVIENELEPLAQEFATYRKENNLW